MSPIIIIVTGGRDYPHWDTIYTALDYVHKRRGVARLYEGGASGADAGARQWALDNGVPLLTFQAEWGKYGRAAGPIRNHAMLMHALEQTMPKMLMAFPGGKGTNGMVELAQAAVASGHTLHLCDLRAHLGGGNGGTVGHAEADAGVGEQARQADDRQPGVKRTH